MWAKRSVVGKFRSSSSSSFAVFLFCLFRAVVCAEFIAFSILRFLHPPVALREFESCLSSSLPRNSDVEEAQDNPAQIMCHRVIRLRDGQVVTGPVLSAANNRKWQV